MRILAVNFHYFREETYPGGIYPVSKKQLEGQIDALSKSYEFLSQERLLEHLSGQNRLEDKDYVILTIDDGLKEQMEAFSFLKQKGIPCILFVPTNPFEFKEVLDVHKLHYVRSVLSDAEMYELLNQRHQIAAYPFDVQLLKNQYRYDDEEARKVKFFLNFVLKADEKKRAVDSFFSSLVEEERAFAEGLYMSEQDLRVLASNMSLGSHGRNHVPLAQIGYEDAKQDVKESVSFLESLTGEHIPSFSYPYGGKGAVNESLLPIFAGTSIRFAFTMWRGINTDLDLQSPYLLKRIDTNDAPGGKLKSLEYV